jgi:hypothetical protein
MLAKHSVQQGCAASVRPYNEDRAVQVHTGLISFLAMGVRGKILRQLRYFHNSTILLKLPTMSIREPLIRWQSWIVNTAFCMVAVPVSEGAQNHCFPICSGSVMFGAACF